MNKGIIGIMLIVGTLYHGACHADHLRSIPQAKSVIVFSPHPDDDILGCGGTIVKHVNAGAYVTIVYMTSGEAATWPEGPEELARLREKEAHRAANKLGVHELLFLREPDSDLQPSQKNIAKIMDILNEYKPDILYVPHLSDSHPDHVATHNIVLKATKRLLVNEQYWMPIIFGYEVWTPLRHISHAIDISKEIKLKLDALGEHKTQTTYMDFVAAVEALNKYRGIMTFMESYGECFDKVDLMEETHQNGDDY